MESVEAHWDSTQVPPRPPAAVSPNIAEAGPSNAAAVATRCMEGSKRPWQAANGDSSTAADDIQKHQPHQKQQQQQQRQQQQQQHQQPEASPPPEAAMAAPDSSRGCCHRHRLHQLHHRCCCRGSRCCCRHREPRSSSSGRSSSGIRRCSMRGRCSCRLGEYSFYLIPRKAQSPGAAFLFSLLQEASPRFRCAVDIGGTLAKLVFIEELGPHSAEAAAAAAAAAAGDASFGREDPQLAAKLYAGNCDAALDLASPLLTIRASPRRVLRFTYFRTKAISALLDCLRSQSKQQQFSSTFSRGLLTGRVLRMTGGGSMKYASLFTEQLGVSIQRTDEMDSIMAGLVLLASHTNSVFRFDLNTRQRVPVDVSRDLYPFLVVNIGSGVSILKAKSASSFVRVTGTCIGGGTVLGLARLLFHAKSFRQVVRLSERGTDALDLRVADLCGDAAGSRCIAPDALASSFGRLYLEDNPERPRPRKEDIARSLIHMVSYNLGYLAYLVGTAHGVRRIFFAGKFINNYDLTMESITQGVNFYMQQYDQHTPQSFLRGPASPLLAAPPDFNVNAQQQALLQQQNLMQQYQHEPRGASPHALLPVSKDSEGGAPQRQQQQGVPRLSIPTRCPAEAAEQPSFAAEAAAATLTARASADGDVSPISIPLRPRPGDLTASQPDQQKQWQQLNQKLSSGASQHSSVSVLCPPHAEPNASAPAACWAPFEVLFLRHDGYLGAVGALVAPGREVPAPN